MKFLQGYNKPIAAIYNTVLQELLVQQHFIRYSKNYAYNEVRHLASLSARDTFGWPCVAGACHTDARGL